MKRGCCSSRRDTVLTNWLYEDGIGEERAILIEQGQIAAARIQRHGGIHAGLVARAQFVKQLVAGKRGIVRLADGHELLLSPLPKGLTQGASLMVEVTRAAIDEKTRFKLPLAKAAPDKIAADAPTLLQRIGSDGVTVTQCHPHEPDHFAEHGWGEVIEQARSGQVGFAGGNLLVAVTPAMTLIDVDGDMPTLPLAMAAAKASAKAIRLLNLQGSIGIDFPGLADKADRLAVAEAFDDNMVGPFERTAVNGFGFLQLVTRRIGPSLPELYQHHRITGHALEALRAAERDPEIGPMTLVAHPMLVDAFEAYPEWLAALTQRTGRAVSLHGDVKLAIGAYYVKAR